LFSKSFTLIYDIIDFYSSQNRDINRNLKKSKKAMLKKAQVTVGISFSLKNAYMKIYKREISVVPQGFRIQDFRKQTATSIKLKRSKCILGFVGVINERLDADLIYKLATKNRNWQFVFVGPKGHDPNISAKPNLLSMERVLRLPNVVWLKGQSKVTMPAIIGKFTIGMIPYRINFEFNRLSYPMKLFEYFYMGKPVVSTPIEELKNLASVLNLDLQA